MRQQNARVSILRVGRELLQSDLGGSNRLYESHRWTGSHRRPKQIGGGGRTESLDSFVSGSFAPVLFYSACWVACAALPLYCLQHLLSLAVWLCPYPVYSACCVALPLCCLQRLLRGFAPVRCTALAAWLVWLCLLYCLQNLLSLAVACCVGFDPILFTVLAVWLCPCPVYSALLGGFAPIRCTALAASLVWLCPYPVYSACCRCAVLYPCLQLLLCGFAALLFNSAWVVLPLYCLQRLLSGFAPTVYSSCCVAFAPIRFYSACCVACVASPLCCLQRLLSGFAPIRFTVLAGLHRLLRGLCVFAPILFTALCCRLLGGFADLSMFTALAVACLQCLLALAVCFCPYPVCRACCVAMILFCSACCVALPLSCLQLLLGGFAPFVFIAPAVRLFPVLFTRLVYRSCCVALPLSCLRRLLHGWVCPCPAY